MLSSFHKHPLLNPLTHSLSFPLLPSPSLSHSPTPLLPQLSPDRITALHGTKARAAEIRGRVVNDAPHLAILHMELVDCPSGQGPVNVFVCSELQVRGKLGQKEMGVDDDEVGRRKGRESVHESVRAAVRKVGDVLGHRGNARREKQDNLSSFFSSSSSLPPSPSPSPSFPLPLHLPLLPSSPSSSFPLPLPLPNSTH